MADPRVLTLECKRCNWTLVRLEGTASGPRSIDTCPECGSHDLRLQRRVQHLEHESPATEGVGDDTGTPADGGAWGRHFSS